MNQNPIFELFEAVCTELSGNPEQVISEDDIDAGVLDEIGARFKQPNRAAAYKHALREIGEHFRRRNARLPYTFDGATRKFDVVDADYVSFVADAGRSRGIGKSSKQFERATTDRLRGLLTGDLHRVGWPRDQHKTRAQMVAYLQGLGFEPKCLLANDKDGGLDILWLPPLGAVPLRAIVSLQCKNGFFDERDADGSNGRAGKTLTRHTHIRSGHLRFVVFNDYIDDRVTERLSGASFLPLGLTDLASAESIGILSIL